MSDDTLFLTCTQCGVEWFRERSPGRIPHRCDICRNPPKTKDPGRPCKGCPTWIAPGPRERNKRVWCSDACRTKAYYRENPEKYEEQKRRARERQKAKRAERGPLEYTKICVFCETGFTAPRVDSRFCSKRCRVQDQVRQENAAYVPKRYDRKCEKCGVKFVAARVNKIYCSKSCNGPARPEKPPKPKKSTIRKLWIRRCEACGDIYSTHQNASRHCTRTCRDRRAKERRDDLKRARGYGVEFSDFARLKVYERDAWTCQLCGEKTSREYNHDDPWSPTLDHIVPLARGGAHTVGNAQIAHAICNSLKSDGEFSPAQLVDYFLENALLDSAA